ncbi:pyridoxal phosphate-dependent aminotransferase [Methanocella conradii]|uniref:pyridoxal phosphate-dependent aminotransferase n=1 Tax=Methanocella conradii TaxID=1175444 RepID=UPI0024B3C040|nr:pyridoxal phosphate-dependent aminotransferase [Methanocella conradii]MDI6896069.1 pyridoxal phosphate-dependent aminotransferase [Methanocella conradii]
MPGRLDSVEESATLRLADLTGELKKQGRDILSFNLGEPDFSTPANIIEAAAKALRSGKTHYAPSAGIPELREAIADKLKKENGIDVAGNDVLVTPGAKQAIFYACFSILEEGDEAIVFDPGWVSYDACIKMSGGKTVWVKSNEDGSLPAELPEHVSNKTKLIIINSPNNPSGAVLGIKDLRLVADVAGDNGLYVLSDEIYEKIIYEAKHLSMGSIIPERTITVNGFSKAYAMAGWRIGYATAPKPVLQNMLKVQQHTVSSPTTFVQYGALAALTGPQDSVERMRLEFKQRRDVVIKGIRGMGLRCEMPQGAFYAWPKVDGKSEEWAERFLEAGVGLTPGSAFGPHSDDHVRMSYASSMEDIKKGLERMAKLLGGGEGRTGDKRQR